MESYGIKLLMAEIRPSPVEVASLSHYRVSYIPGGARFQPSTVWNPKVICKLCHSMIFRHHWEFENPNRILFRGGGDSPNLP